MQAKLSLIETGKRNPRIISLGLVVVAIRFTATGLLDKGG